MELQKDKILVLDFGSQYTQLIARKLREIGIYCEIYSHDLSGKTIVTPALNQSLPDMMTSVGVSAGKEGVALDKKHEEEVQAENVYKKLEKVIFKGTNRKRF